VSRRVPSRSERSAFRRNRRSDLVGLTGQPNAAHSATEGPPVRFCARPSSGSGDEDPASGKAVLGDRGQRHGRISGHRKAQAELGVRTTAPQPDPPDTRSELPRIGLGRSAALTQFRFLWVIYSTGVVARRAERFLPRIENPPNANVGVSQSDHSKSAGPDSFRSPGSKFCLRPVLLMSIYSSVEDR